MRTVLTVKCLFSLLSVIFKRWLFLHVNQLNINAMHSTTSLISWVSYILVNIAFKFREFLLYFMLVVLLFT